MKLTEDIKKKIDKFFDEISPEDLYTMAVEKYNFKENTEIEIEEKFFYNSQQFFPVLEQDSSFDSELEHTNMSLAA